MPKKSLRLNSPIVLTVLLSLLLPAIAFAQRPEMADAMRSNGKIYVVVAAVAIVFLGIVAYLIRLDRKISRMEKNQNKAS